MEDLQVAVRDMIIRVRPNTQSMLLRNLRNGGWKCRARLDAGEGPARGSQRDAVVRVQDHAAYDLIHGRRRSDR